MFRNFTFQRATSSIVLVAFTTVTLSPLAQARGAYGAAVGTISASKASPRTAGPDERFAQILADIEDDLKAAVPLSAFGKHVPQAGKAGWGHADMATKANSLRARNEELKSLYQAIENDFANTGQHLRDARVAPEILDRHAAAVSQYQGRKDEFDKLMAAVAAAEDNSAAQATAMAALGGFAAKYPNAKRHQYSNPDKLPFGLSDGKVRAPYVSKEMFQASLFPPTYDKVMLAGPIPDGLQFAQAVLPRTPNGADLAETDDVQISPAIRSQAAALNHNPVAIYNWVRNNIQFIPSYGSIQGSDMTLQYRRGNAFDTASLLIALYRASGVPARYVYGTVDVPVDKAMNWVGGVSKPGAAQSLLGQGGIPNIGMLSGGAVSAIRMEHVWVQAYVDNSPSRGAVNKAANAWVSMDASFKQYQFDNGMDLANNVPAASQAVLDQLQQGATVNSAEGSVQNINQGGLPAALADYQTRVKTYIDSQKAHATVDDVIGGQKIVGQSYGILPGTLPYKTVVVANTFQSLPDNLRWKFKTNIYAADGFADASNPLIELNQGTAKLAGKKVTLSFVPASQADQDLLTSYLPKANADGSPVSPSEFPQSLPGYLLKMKAELRVDGQAVALSGQSFTMGSDVMQSNQYFNPAKGNWEGGADIAITVGEYNAIGLDLQGSVPGKQAELARKMASTKARLLQFQLNPNDPSPIAGLTKEEITGDLTYSVILSYFSQIDANDEVLARTMGGVTSYRLPSYGRAYTAAEPHYYFGIVRNVSFPGVGLDVAYVFNHTAAKDDDPAKSRQFMRQVGAAGSATEHVVPERLFGNPALAFGDPSQPVGVSAVRILSVAAAQGQKIYTLSVSNTAMHAAILQNLQIGADAKSEISNALAAGKEVTVHAKNVSVNGWSGSGYLLIDPDTGGGAYKIAGGTNGGFLKWVDSNSALLGLAAWAIGLAGGIWFALAIAIVFTIVLAGILLYIEDSDGSCGSVGIALYATLEILFAVLGAFAAPLYGWVFWLLGFQADGGIRAALTHCNRSS